MKTFFQAAAFAAAASAAVLPRDQCCFQITATGAVSGIMGQLFDGQNRINGTYAPATYCFTNGGIVDSTGRGCVVTYTNDATHQFQCDLSRSPSYGFSIAANGSILYQGSNQFYACPATDTEYNVYTSWLSGQDKCKPVSLSTTATNGTCGAASSPSGGVSASSGGAPGSSSAIGSTSADQSVPIETSVSGGTAPGYSAPAYSPSVHSTSTPAHTASTQVAPGYSAPSVSVSVPSYSGSGGLESVPAYSTPLASETAPTHASSATSVPGYSQASALYSSGSTPISETAPGYSALSVAIASTPARSIHVQSSTEVVPTYLSAQIQSPPYETTMTAETTYSTIYYPVTETQVSSGTTSTNVYSTWSAYTVVGSSSSSVEIPSASSPAIVPGYGTSPITVSTPTVSMTFDSTPALSSTISVPGYGSSQSSLASVSVPVSSVSIPGYSSIPTEATGSILRTSQAASSVPGYGSSTSTTAATTSVVSPYSQSPSSQAATSTSANACQTSLSGAYQTPHLIIPISSASPSTAYGTQYNATIDSTTSTIFNFDIPASYSGKTCSIIFLFPEQADLETSAYTFSGSGSLEFSRLSGAATEETTYDSAPAIEETLDTIAIQSGNSYVVGTAACSAGTTESIELSSSGGLSLEFFEDWNPSSLGLYITAC